MMKFLFLVTDFNVGGITSSLVNLTNELISNKHQVSILNLPKAKGIKGFNKNVKFIELNGRARLWNLSKQDIKKAKWFRKPWLVMLGLYKKLTNKHRKWTKWVFSKFSIDDNFDYAIAFRQEPTSIYLVANKINCNLKVAFWHAHPGVENTSSWDMCLYDVDVVAGVSNAVCDALKEQHLGLNTKTVYNIFNSKDIKEKGQAYDCNYSKKFNLVTVSRIEFEQKKNNIIPIIAKRLKADGFDFCWTIVGDGPNRRELENIIKAEQLNNCINVVGVKENPYPYIKQADLFVLTSKSESYGMVVMESLILNTPVVAGEYPALEEILDDGVTGVIAQNSIDGIYQAIKNIMTDKSLYQSLKKNCDGFEYSSLQTYNQFMSLGEGIND